MSTTKQHRKLPPSEQTHGHYMKLFSTDKSGNPVFEITYDLDTKSDLLESNEGYFYWTQSAMQKRVGLIEYANFDKEQMLIKGWNIWIQGVKNILRLDKVNEPDFDNDNEKVDERYTNQEEEN